MKIVLDTNLIVSGFISGNYPPGLLVQAWLDGAYILLTNEKQIVELERVLQYERVKKFIRAEQAENFLENMGTRAVQVNYLPDISLSPDPDDNIMLAVAIAGKADYLITGDKRDLLFLKEVEGIPIITARAALEILSGH